MRIDSLIVSGLGSLVDISGEIGSRPLRLEITVFDDSTQSPSEGEPITIAVKNAIVSSLIFTDARSPYSAKGRPISLEVTDHAVLLSAAIHSDWMHGVRLAVPSECEFSVTTDIERIIRLRRFVLLGTAYRKGDACTDERGDVNIRLQPISTRAEAAQIRFENLHMLPRATVALHADTSDRGKQEGASPTILITDVQLAGSLALSAATAAPYVIVDSVSTVSGRTAALAIDAADIDQLSLSQVRSSFRATVDRIGQLRMSDVTTPVLSFCPRGQQPLAVEGEISIRVPISAREISVSEELLSALAANTKSAAARRSLFRALDEAAIYCDDGSGTITPIGLDALYYRRKAEVGASGSFGPSVAAALDVMTGFGIKLTKPVMFFLFTFALHLLLRLFGVFSADLLANQLNWKDWLMLVAGALPLVPLDKIAGDALVEQRLYTLSSRFDRLWAFQWTIASIFLGTTVLS